MGNSRAVKKEPGKRRERVMDVFWVVVALAIVAAGVLGFGALGALKTPVKAEPIVRVVPLVETAVVQWHDDAVPVSGVGFIRPSQQVELSAETSGRIMSLHPSVQSRGRVWAGDVIARLDDRTAQASLQRAKSDLDSTQVRLDLNGTQLEREQTLRARGAISEDALDQRIAEGAELTATLASLQSALESARVAVDATLIKAPFDGQVLEKRAELGTVLNPGQAVVTLFTPDKLEVGIALEESEAALIPNLFGLSANASLTDATVTASFAGQEHTWPASITRVAPALSPTTRTLEVSVQLDVSSNMAQAAPALINTWADVKIAGRSDRPVIAVPSAQLRAGNTLWLVVNGKLRIVDITLIQVDEQISYVTLDENALGVMLSETRLVTSVLAAPVDDMSVQTVESESNSDVETAATLEVGNANP